MSTQDTNEQGEVVRDRIWIWSQVTGAYNEPYLNCLQKKSTITPPAAAEYMGIRNTLVVTFHGQPAPPFDEYYKQFAGLDKVIWSLTGACGATSEADRRSAIELAEKNQNIVGFVLDDFFCGGALPPPPVQWLAEVNVKFPVTLTLTPPAKISCDSLEITQSAWVNGDYRTKDFEVDISADGQSWRQVAAGTMPNKAGEKYSVKLPGDEFAALRIHILSTYDTGGGMSCGLTRLHLYHGGQDLDISKWQADASSAYDVFKPKNLLMDENDMPLPAVLTPQQLAEIRSKLVIRGKRLPLAAVVYTDNISPRAIHHIRQVDWVQMWTWRPPELNNLEQNLARLEKVLEGAPDTRIFLGCYMYDFDQQKPIPMELMKKQAELGLKWLKEGRIEGIIFLGTAVCDVDLEAVEWTREWFARVGDEKLSARH